jgi:hypothetical protein
MRRQWNPQDHQGTHALSEFTEKNAEEVRPGDLVAFPFDEPRTYATIHSVRRGEAGDYPETERISHTGEPLTTRTNVRARLTRTGAEYVVLYPVEGQGVSVPRTRRVLVLTPPEHEWAILGTLLKGDE